MFGLTRTEVADIVTMHSTLSMLRKEHQRWVNPEGTSFNLLILELTHLVYANNESIGMDCILIYYVQNLGDARDVFEIFTKKGYSSQHANAIITFACRFTRPPLEGVLDDF